jgi:D-aminopeptidase
VCVIVLATDAPLDSRRLARVAWRSIIGMARTGSNFSGRSGDYALAFSTTANDPELAGAGPLPDSALDPLFAAAIDATEEAILNLPPASPSPFNGGHHVRLPGPRQARRAA